MQGSPFETAQQRAPHPTCWSISSNTKYIIAYSSAAALNIQQIVQWLGDASRGEVDHLPLV
jgi:hypothetical protein